MGLQDLARLNKQTKLFPPATASRRTPWKNPRITDKQRNTYFQKRLLEWKSEYERIYRERQCKSHQEGIRSFVARRKLSDHMTRELLGQLIGKRIGIPQEKAQKYDSRLQKDIISGILGISQDISDSVAFVKELHQDSVTGDIEWVFYNANNPDDTREHIAKNNRYQTTMQRRDSKRAANSKKDKKVRKRVLQTEEDRGIF